MPIPSRVTAVAVTCVSMLGADSALNADAKQPPSAALVVFGTVTEIKPGGPELKPWVVSVKVERVVSGEFSGTKFQFAVHSPARSGLKVGRSYLVEAVWNGEGYTVDDLQWMRRACEGSLVVRGECFDVSGKLAIWNGWPPNIRLQASKELYGIGPVDHEIVPGEVRIELRLHNRLRGRFRLCPLGKKVSVPYLKKPITLNCLERMIPDSSTSP